MNDFIATNAPSSVRSLRFSPPPKHDQHGNLITPSSDTEDSPTPEPPQKNGSAGATAKDITYGFAGGDDASEEEDGPEIDRASATHSSDVKPTIPSAPASGNGALHGFAAGDEDEDEDEDELGQDRPAAPVPAPAGEAAHGFAGSSDDDDDGGGGRNEAMRFLEPKPLPAGSFAHAGSPKPHVVTANETATSPFGFAGDDDDDDDDDMYFPHLTPFEQASAAAAAQPAEQAPLERVKMEDAPQGFAGDSDDEDDDLGGPAVDDAATVAQKDVSMADSTAQINVSTDSQLVSDTRVEEDHRQDPVEKASAGTARVEPIRDANTGETTQLGGRTRDVGDEQQKLAESSTADAATNGHSLAARHEADVARATVARSARAAPAGETSAPLTAISPSLATGGTTAPAHPAPEEDNRSSRQPAKPTTSSSCEQDVTAAGSAAQPRVSSSPVASRKSALPHSGRETSQDADVERARLPTKRKRTTDTAGDAAGAGGEAPGNALSRKKILRKAEKRAGEISPVDTHTSPGPSGGSDSRGSGSASKAADPFNHGRTRTNVSNGYIRWNAAALRSKNFPQTLTMGERVSWPDDGPYSVFDGSGDVELEKIKYIWSMGRYGDPINGTDTIDELFTPLSGEMIDVWIAPPPDENKAGLSKTARAHLHEYYALQLVLSSYEGLRQADSPRNSVKIVFVHVSKLGELGSTNGAFAQLEHLRCQPGTRFFVYGRGENSKRAVFQFWRSGV